MDWVREVVAAGSAVAGCVVEADEDIVLDI